MAYLTPLAAPGFISSHEGLERLCAEHKGPTTKEAASEAVGGSVMLAISTAMGLGIFTMASYATYVFADKLVNEFDNKHVMAQSIGIALTGFMVVVGAVMSVASVGAIGTELKQPFSRLWTPFARNRPNAVCYLNGALIKKPSTIELTDGRIVRPIESLDEMMEEADDDNTIAAVDDKALATAVDEKTKPRNPLYYLNGVCVGDVETKKEDRVLFAASDSAKAERLLHYTVTFNANFNDKPLRCTAQLLCKDEHEGNAFSERFWTSKHMYLQMMGERIPPASDGLPHLAVWTYEPAFIVADQKPVADPKQVAEKTRA